MTKNITSIAIAGIMSLSASGALRADALSAPVPSAPASDAPAPASLFGSPAPIAVQPAPAADSTPAAPIDSKVVAAPAPSIAPASPVSRAPFDMAVLAANRASWPRTVRLTQAIPFPAVFDGKVVGSMTIPAGTTVQLDGMEGAYLVLDFHSGIQRVAWQYTDIKEQVSGTSPSAAVQSVNTASKLVSAAGVNGPGAAENN